MNGSGEILEDNVLDAKERIQFKNIGDFYELGDPEDWKDLVKYSRFYLSDENEDRRGMIYNLLRPVLLKRFKEVYPGNFAEIMGKVAALTDQKKTELRAFIRNREATFGGVENLKEAA
ncbi:MAG: hypothetical protein UV67_C0037G0005 [Parcubacteria group bacterium GW2011_GWC1_43_12]|nr:MAG: hypothetical protein UV67_C0037G0005 [Parcubacteria group bacterium GW2011_GWC1_43_12]